MAQSTAQLTGMGQGYAPLAEGIPHTDRTGFEGVPFLGQGQGASGALVQMAAMPVLSNAMGRAGMLPTGIGHDQNAYDTLKAMQFSQLQMQAMRTAAEADRANYLNLARGMAAATGTPFGADQHRAANAVINPLVQASPYLAQVAPQFLDQANGRRGSAVVMASALIDAGRYRVDPVTGRTGMSADTVGLAARSLYTDLYSDRNIGQMGGIRAGELGGMFAELQKRGMVRASEFSPQDQLRQAVEGMARTGDLGAVARRQGVNLQGGVAGLSGADLDKLGLDSAVSDKLRSLDVSKIKRTLQGYTGAIAAMKDIFGDAGHPNPTMQQLVQGLETLTAGSLGQIDSGRLGQMAKQTYNLAKQSGVPLDAALLMQQDAGQRARALGLEGIFATHATQGALGFGEAYRARGMAAHPAWGARNADQMTQLDSNLRLQASGSNAANRVGTAMRLRDSLGGFQKGSDAFLMTQAVAAGLDTFKDSTGSVRSVNLNEGDYIRMLTTAKGANGQDLNLGEGDIRDFLSQRSTNREFIEKHGVDAIIRRRQGEDEIKPFIGEQMRGTLRGGLRGAFGDDEAARRVSGAVAQRVTRRIFDSAEMSRGDFADRQTRNRKIAAILGEELKGTELGGRLAGMTAADRGAFLTKTAEQFYGRSERALAQSHMRGLGGMQDVFGITSQDTLDAADAAQNRAALTTRMQAAMAPLGRGSLLENMVDGIGDVDPDDPAALTKFVATALGGVATKDVAAGLVGPAQAVAQSQKRIAALQAKVSAEKDPVARANLQKQLAGAERELKGQASDLANFAKRAGLVRDGVSVSDIQGASKALGNVPPVHTAPPRKGGEAALAARRQAFWGSSDGARYRASIATAEQAVSEVAGGLIATPAAVRKLGTRALDLHEGLVIDQQRLRDLASQNAGGDVAKLMAGDLKPNVRDPQAIRDETRQIQLRQQAIVAELNDKEGRAGKQWRPDKEEALRLMGLRPGASLTAAQEKELAQVTRDVSLARRLSPAQEAVLAGRDAGKRAALAQSLGVAPSALGGAQRVLGRLAAMQDAALSRATEPGQDVAARLAKAFGVGHPDGQVSGPQRELAGLIESGGGRDLARRVLSSQSALQSVAAAGGGKGLAGIDAMVSEYDKALGGDPKSRQHMIAAFQTKYGMERGKDGKLTDNAARRWSDVQKAISFQKQTDFLRFGGEGRKLGTDEEMLNLFSSGLKGELAPREPSKPATTTAFNGRIDGTLRITGDRGDIVAAMGGSRGAVIG